MTDCESEATPETLYVLYRTRDNQGRVHHQFASNDPDGLGEDFSAFVADLQADNQLHYKTGCPQKALSWLFRCPGCGNRNQEERFILSDESVEGV